MRRVLLILPFIFGLVLNSIADDSKPKIGVLLPLSGGVGPFGLAFQKGFLLASDDPTNPASQCHFLFEDSEHNTARALSAYRKLTTADKVRLLYVFGAPIVETLAPIAEKQKVPVVTNHIEPAISSGHKYILRYASSREEIGESFSNFFVAHGLKKIGLVHTENSWFNNIILGIHASGSGQFQLVDLGTVNPEQTDMNTVANKLGTSDSDAYLLFVYPGQLSALARALAPYQRRNPRQILGAENVGNPQDIEAAHGALEGAVFPTNNVRDEFRRRYAEKYQNIENIRHAAEGYDVAGLIGAQVCSEKSFQSSDDIMQSLEKAVITRAAQGNPTLKRLANGDRYFSASLKMFRVENSSVVKVD